MVENRWQIILGAVVLLVILLTGAFSLGIYVGRHGWGEDGLRYQPAGPEGGQGAPPGDPQDFVVNHPDLVGRIRALSQLGIQLATQDGPRIIELSKNTLVEDEIGAPLKLTDLRLGDLIAVFGDFTPGDGQRLVASQIVRLPERKPQQP
ncbi:MAG: hypothetical protein AMJ88_01715 [Anaerolineae bacterium SM23_ 63]|nr:MAG: hypothetical protein AMJ88_01715 [Anaerolineae bacterium SM23_ 63]HEY47812.1 hypothetical protein [Anaerolineae bacterium]